MKAALLLLSLPFASSAQKLIATASPRTFYVGKEKAPLYRFPADTAGKPNTYLYPDTEASVVGDYSPRWAIVRDAGYLYLISTQQLSNYQHAALGYQATQTDGTPIPIDPTTHRITYQGVIETTGATKDQLYSRAQEWVAKTYNSAQAVVQMQDKESGKLVIKGLSRVHIRNSAGGTVAHTLSIYVKDGRYKYIITDLTHAASGAPNIFDGGPLENENGRVYSMSSKKAWADIRQEANHNVLVIIASLKAAMTLSTGKDPSDF